jgi:hypothetical protein
MPPLVQDEERFALGTRNDLRVENAILIREVGVDADGAVIITKIPGVEGRQQRTATHANALTV